VINILDQYVSTAHAASTPPTAPTSLRSVAVLLDFAERYSVHNVDYLQTTLCLVNVVVLSFVFDKYYLNIN